MTDKHTPGPWYTVISRPQWQIRGHNGEYVGLVNPGSSEEPLPQKANAELIALAPDMTQRIEELEGQLERATNLLGIRTRHLDDEEAEGVRLLISNRELVVTLGLMREGFNELGLYLNKHGHDPALAFARRNACAAAIDRANATKSQGDEAEEESHA